jgi:transposase
LFVAQQAPKEAAGADQNQIEALLEESQIKLSSVITDLLGVSGHRILKALAKGETDPAKLAELAADNLKASREQLAEAVSGAMQSRHSVVLAMQLEELDLLDQHIAELGPEAVVFETAQQMASWIGVCPEQEQRRQSKSNRSGKGNRTMRRVLNQVAWSAVRTKDSFFQELYHRLIPRLGIHKAIWASHTLLPKWFGKYCTIKFTTSSGARWHWIRWR